MVVLNLCSIFFKEALVAESWNIKPTCLKHNYAITSFLNGKQMKIMNELDQIETVLLLGLIWMLMKHCLCSHGGVEVNG